MQQTESDILVHIRACYARTLSSGQRKRDVRKAPVCGLQVRAQFHNATTALIANCDDFNVTIYYGLRLEPSSRVFQKVASGAESGQWCRAVMPVKIRCRWSIAVLSP